MNRGEQPVKVSSGQFLVAVVFLRVGGMSKILRTSLEAQPPGAQITTFWVLPPRDSPRDTSTLIWHPNA